MNSCRKICFYCNYATLSHYDLEQHMYTKHTTSQQKAFSDTLPSITTLPKNIKITIHPKKVTPSSKLQPLIQGKTAPVAKDDFSIPSNGPREIFPNKEKVRIAPRPGIYSLSTTPLESAWQPVWVKFKRIVVL